MKTEQNVTVIELPLKMAACFDADSGERRAVVGIFIEATLRRQLGWDGRKELEASVENGVLKISLKRNDAMPVEIGGDLVF